ncbi:MAG: radical SAM protein, partial [Lentisphaeria bacterium]|nr:radical SAM protein [Lentisphaeria bacterium]
CTLDEAGVYHDDGTRAVRDAWATAPPPCGSPFFDTAKPFVQIETARGCALGCSYCTSGTGLPPRYRAIGSVREELRQLRERGVRQVRVLDRTFNLPPARAARLLELFLEAFPEIRFHLEVHPAYLPSELRRILRRAPPGRLHVEAGLQTTSARSLAASQRRGGPRRALDGIRFLARCPGFETHVDLLAGLPEQRLDDVRRDVHQLLAIGPAEIQLEVLKVLPGTPLRLAAPSLGIRFSPVPPYEVIETPHLSRTDLTRVRRLSRILDRFPLRHPLGHCLRYAVCEDPGLLDRLAAESSPDGEHWPPTDLAGRFRLLRRCLRPQADDATDELRLAWLASGLKPTDAFCGALPWKQPLPPDALPAAGAQSPGQDHTTRVYHLELPTRECWAVFRRSIQPTTPVAILQRDRR